MNYISVACVVVMCLRMAAVVSNPHAKKLYKHLLIDNKYNKLIRPVDANNEVLTVRLGLRLSQLIGIVCSLPAQRSLYYFY